MLSMRKGFEAINTAPPVVITPITETPIAPAKSAGSVPDRLVSLQPKSQNSFCGQIVDIFWSVLKWIKNNILFCCFSKEEGDTEQLYKILSDFHNKYLETDYKIENIPLFHREFLQLPEELKTKIKLSMFKIYKNEFPNHPNPWYNTLVQNKLRDDPYDLKPMNEGIDVKPLHENIHVMGDALLQVCIELNPLKN